MPVLLLAAEGRYLVTGDTVWRSLAHRWSKVFAVLFAVGAVSGTVLSFELGLLWPTFMSRYGAMIGFPFAGITVLLSLATGAYHDLDIAPYQGKGK